MNILAIECTHEAVSAAVCHNSVVTEAAGTEWKRAAETLVPLVEQVLMESSLGRNELDGIAISSGPGSFTALRIGMSAAKGMAYGLGVPLIPVPTMPAMADSLQACDGMVMAVIQARKGEYYFASYHPGELSAGLWHNEVHRGAAADVVAAISVCTGRTIVVGRRLEALSAPLADAGALYKEADFFSAKSLFFAAERLFAANAAAALAQVTPDYRQMFIPNVGRE